MAEMMCVHGQSVRLFDLMAIENLQPYGEARFTDPASELHQNLDRYLGGVMIRGAAQLAAISQSWTITAKNPATYSSVVRSWQHGKLLLTHCAGDGVTFHRAPENLGDSYDRYVQLAVLKSGKIKSMQRGVAKLVEPNSIITLLLEEEFFSSTTDEMDVILFYVPRSYLESRGLNTDLMAGATLDNALACDSIRALVDWAFILQLRNEDTQRGFIERALLELLTGVGIEFTEGFTYSDEPSNSVRSQVLNIIDSSYSNPETSVDSIAKTLGFSRRQIYRFFEGREVSITKMIRERRIDRAELLLRLPVKKTVAAIAEECGFGGPDQLARAFKERHSCSPLEYRANARRFSS